MTLPFQIGGARVVIPGVYDVLRVQASLPAPVPAGRSVLILGESDRGVPGNALDLRLNFFTDFQSVKDYYGTGSIVDAARMAFTAQPSPVFGGAIQRLYVWKTNQTTRALKLIASPANYGTLFAAKYGEQGNFIKSQIKGLSEVLPSRTFSVIPSPVARTVKVSVDGNVLPLSLSPADITTGAGCATQFAALMGAVPGLTVAASPIVPAVAALGVTITTLSAVGDNLTLTTSDTFLSGLVAGDIVVIPEGSVLSGPASENAGVYEVVSWGLTSVTLKQLTHWLSTAEANPVAFYLTGPMVAVDTTMIAGFKAVTVNMTHASVAGQGATLELAATAGALVGSAEMLDLTSFNPAVSAGDAAVGSVSATLSGTDGLVVALQNASWLPRPAKGDVVQIGRTSVIAGATKKNVGLFVVTASSAQSITIKKAVAGLVTEAVALVPLAGVQGVVEVCSGFISNTAQPQVIESASESKVWIEAMDVASGIAFPTTQIGGTTFIEIGFFGASACTVSIDAFRVMTISPAVGTPVVVRLAKFKSLQNLVDFLNTQAGIFAVVPDPRNKNLPTSVLDAVAGLGCLSAFSSSSANAKIKGDYYSFKKFLDDNFGLLAFGAGTMALKAGLPSAEASATFLSGAVVGATTDADIQSGLDQSLKIDVRYVVPLFSRDASDDVQDSLTDPGSTYSIDSVHAAVKGHVATASSIKVKRERFGGLSIHESFENAMLKCATVGYERCQMAFELVNAVSGDGTAQWFLPWMGVLAIAAGRAQSILGTSMLRKTFAFSGVKHIGKQSLFSDTLTQDFDPEDQGQLEQAIEAGLLVFRAVQGFGVRLESPDLTSRSRENDPEGWVWERANVLFTLDEVVSTARNVLENFIGNRQADTSLAVVKEALNKVLSPFISSGSLVNAIVDKVVKEGVGYRASIRVLPAEALEFIGLDVLAERAA